jgi:hypothetical protein
MTAGLTQLAYYLKFVVRNARPHLEAAQASYYKQKMRIICDSCVSPRLIEINAALQFLL